MVTLCRLHLLQPSLRESPAAPYPTCLAILPCPAYPYPARSCLIHDDSTPRRRRCITARNDGGRQGDWEVRRPKTAQRTAQRASTETSGELSCKSADEHLLAAVRDGVRHNAQCREVQVRNRLLVSAYTQREQRHSRVQWDANAGVHFAQRHSAATCTKETLSARTLDGGTSVGL
jgi:hypothetical protein